MGNQKSALPYDIGEEDTSFYANAETGWKLFSGTKKSDGSSVSVFRFDKKDEKNKSYIPMAENMFKRTKTLRHPQTLLYLDGIEMDTEILIVTEKVVPLEFWLREVLGKTKQQKTKNMAIAWGMDCLLKIVGFLNNDCKLIHGNISTNSIFVTPGGDWKLGGFYITGEVDPVERGPGRLFKENSRVLAAKYKPPERLKNQWSAIVDPVWGSDIWAVGCVLYECFNGTVSSPDDFLQSKNIPSFLRKLYVKMLSSNPQDRPHAKQLYESEGFKRAFNNRYVASMRFIEEIQLKSVGEKMDFFQRVNAELDSFPEHANKYKILKVIRDTQNIQGNNAQDQRVLLQMAAILLEPVLKIGASFTDDDEYKEHVVPAIVHLFSCNDRAVRVNLLQGLDRYIKYFDEKIINEKIFVSVCTGFGDTTPVLRELTLKSMLLFAPKLNEQNINDVLMRHLVRLQNDKEPSIRTNTVICLSRIVEHTNDATRDKIIIGAFTKAARESFVHTRIAGIKAIASTYNQLLSTSKIPLITSKLLPAVCLALSDPTPEVRSMAFLTVKKILKDLEKNSNERAKQQKEEMEAKSVENDSRPATPGSSSIASTAAASPASAAGASASALFSSAAGWASASISAWGTSETKSGTGAITSQVDTQSTSAPSDVKPAATTKVAEKPKAVHNDGWGDDDDDDFTDNFDDAFDSLPAKTSTAKTLSLPSRGGMKLSNGTVKNPSDSDPFTDYQAETSTASKKADRPSKEERRKALEKRREAARQRKAKQTATKRVSASEMAKSALKEDDFFSSF